MAACEIRTDYDLAIDDDSSATLALDMFYDMQAAELLGSGDEFLQEEIQGDFNVERDGVTLVSAEAGVSDSGCRITAVFEAVHGEAFDGLVDVPGSSFTSSDGATWILILLPGADLAEDLDDELDLGNFGLDLISGEVRLEHAGPVRLDPTRSAPGDEAPVERSEEPETAEPVEDRSTVVPDHRRRHHHAREAPGEQRGSRREPGSRSHRRRVWSGWLEQTHQQPQQQGWQSPSGEEPPQDPTKDPEPAHLPDRWPRGPRVDLAADIGLGC